MDSNNLVSVIIPVYNCEKYLAEAIESVLGQTYHSFETIVVDDGSTDRSGDIAKGFREQELQYFYQPNSGIGAARNQGVRQARGNYFAFLDSDDYWLPNKLALQMSAFDDDPELDIVFGRFNQFYDSGSETNSKTKAKHEERNLPGHFAGTMMIKRKSFFRVGLFDTHWRIGEFVDWYAKATEMGLKLLMLPRVVMERRIHTTNIGIRERKSQVDYVRILKRALDRRRIKSPNNKSKK